MEKRKPDNLCNCGAPASRDNKCFRCFAKARQDKLYLKILKKEVVQNGKVSEKTSCFN